MAIEVPIILAQNVLDGATVSLGPDSEVVGHEIDRLRDGYRHTWFELPNTDAQYIYVRAKNMITNYGFEVDLLDWYLYEETGVGTMARNTTSPINGDADCKIITTDVDNADKKCALLGIKRLFFKAGRTYRLMFRGTSTAASTDIKYGFIASSDLTTEDTDFTDTGVIEATGSGLHIDVTPTADTTMLVYIRIMENDTVYLDDIVVGEVRDVDTIIIDSGHTMFYASLAVGYRDDESAGSYSNALEEVMITSDSPVYKTFTAKKSLSWLIKLAAFSSYSDIPLIKVPILYLGKRWELPHNFEGQFDPHETKMDIEKVISDRGITQCVHKYSQRLFKATLNHISSTDYANIKWFMEDTENGAKPFFFMWRPTTDPADLLFMRLSGGRSVPYTGQLLRSWGFDAEEVIGKRAI